ncbi:hypothetical protein FRACYDRAFT_250568 [Fragilariopsis cylindrus CCMP1102]|uniref:Phosphatidic acid phosphatase type 2/haloperoxidase domain-containing protein n=1 Tax=Fragilariopsis cylindrus CCMP1102 TaxID=635003 RepID=A0A1E7EQ55_9STRA|nr:hypothetical protein FRACYDRAFT_250568 [Fragilariopsis cylindrus CCMP1102]|eukprot:OEU07937.1 hypothetical protein FRACYDRAFT_250568 [Fragilariopsis cylindrus CCMP1102]
MNHRNGSATTTIYGSGNFVAETVELERIPLTSNYIYYQPRERPIPYEHLGMSGGIGTNTASSSGTSTVRNNAGGNDDNDEDTREKSLYSYPNTVWNLVNSEKFLGDTISSTECKLYALILPLMLQLFMVWFLWILPPGSNPVATATAVNNSNNKNNNNNNRSGNNSNSTDIGLFHRWMPSINLAPRASRVVDNRHFPADVVGGAVLGASIASLVFNIWFPSR